MLGVTYSLEIYETWHATMSIQVNLIPHFLILFTILFTQMWKIPVLLDEENMQKLEHFHHKLN